MPQPEIDIVEVAKKCMDNPGYVMFVGVMTNKRDDKGMPMIDMFYRRFNFSFEDSFMCIKEFRNNLVSDVEGFEQQAQKGRNAGEERRG